MTQKRQTSTKQDIKQAVVYCLKQKEFDAITIGEIAKKAGINRGTFYLHYVDKYDMMDKITQDILDEILSILLRKIQENQQPYDCIVEIFTYLSEEIEFLSILTERLFNYSHRIMYEFTRQLCETIPNIQYVLTSQADVPLDYAQEIFIYKNEAIVFNWIKKGGIESPEKIAKIFIATSTHL